jgi:hypothetical protein
MPELAPVTTHTRPAIGATVFSVMATIIRTKQLAAD